MITINRVIQITQGQSPYRVIVNTTGTSNITERSNNIYEIELFYDSEEQIGTGDSVTVIDDNSCIRSIPLQITNICENFYVSEIQRTQGFGNTTQTTLGGQSFYSVETNQAVTVDWSIDDPAYYTIEAQGQSVLITQVDSGIQQTKIRASVTNQNGCTEERSYALFPCRTLAQPVNQILRFNPETNLYEANRVALRGSTSCQDASIDWSTLQLSNNTQASITQRIGQPYVDITSASPITTANIFYSVANDQGLRSNTSRITISTDENNLTTLDGFNIPPVIVIVTNEETDIVIDLDKLGINGVTGINTTLTSANTATYSNGLVQANITGQQAPTIGLNTEQGPTVISVIRQLANYTPATIEQAVYCGPANISLTSEPDIAGVNFLVSGDASLKLDLLTINSNNQAVIVNVSNADGQSNNVTIYACGDCGTDTNVSSCNTTNNLFDLLDGDPRPDGTWTSPSSDPLPVTYNGTVDLPTTGLKSYTYSAPAFVGEYECTATTSYNLSLLRINGGNVVNNNCANATAINSIVDAGQTLTTGEISTSCAVATTYSNNTGNRVAYTYDQWFTYNSQVSGGQTARVTITLTGTGNTPINDVALEIWSDCSTPVVSTNNQTINSYTAVFDNSVGIIDYKIQVLSNTIGNYSLSVSQEII